MGDWYVFGTFDVFERTERDCPEPHDHPLCYDTRICEVDDLLHNAEKVAQRIADLHNQARRGST